MIAPNPSTGDESGGLETQYGYDADGNLTSETDPLGNVTTYKFDAAGRETAEYAPNPSNGDYDPGAGSPETSYAYNAAGYLETLTDPDSYATTYGYDNLGRETSSSEEVAETSTTTVDATTAFTYDGDNNLIEQVNANNLTTVYSYNDLDQQIEEQWYTSSGLGTLTNTITTTYDLSGDVTNSTDSYAASDSQDSEYTFTYNTLGQQVQSNNDGSGVGGSSGTVGVDKSKGSGVLCRKRTLARTS